MISNKCIIFQSFEILFKKKQNKSTLSSLFSYIFITFACDNILDMAQDIIRLKLVLAENRRTNRWWQNKWENPLVQLANGVATPVSQIWLPWEKLRHY